MKQSSLKELHGSLEAPGFDDGRYRRRGQDRHVSRVGGTRLRHPLCRYTRTRHYGQPHAEECLEVVWARSRGQVGAYQQAPWSKPLRDGAKELGPGLLFEDELRH